MSKRDLYLILCDELDYILRRSGVRKICVECSTMKIYKGKVECDKENGFNETSDLGCCTGCKYLGKRGCKTKALMCKTWLCSERLVKKIKKAGYWERFCSLCVVARNYGWMNMRSGVDDYFKKEKEK